MKKLIYILIFLSCLPMMASGAEYTYYFKDDGLTGAQDCDTPAGACKCLSQYQDGCDSGDTDMEDLITAASTGDVVNLLLFMDDTFSFETGTETTQTKYIFDTANADPHVKVDLYNPGGGSSNPIIDGGVPDFSDPGVLEHNENGSGPLAWNYLFKFAKNGNATTYSSVKNIHFQNFYGRAIGLGDSSNGADYFVAESNVFHNYGMAVIGGHVTHNSRHCTLQYNLVYDGSMLFFHGLDNGLQWPPAIVFGGSGQNTITAAVDNYVAYNVLYNIAGEGINNAGGTTEYNLIGDTSSAAIHGGPQRQTVDGTTIMRYNFITMSNSSAYKVLANTSYDGIDTHDEDEGGSNVNLAVEIYGNIIINRQTGIWLYEGGEVDSSGTPEPFKSIKVFNNTVIDSEANNIRIYDCDQLVDGAGKGYIYNNAFIYYNHTDPVIHTQDLRDCAALTTYFTIANNAYWDETAGDEGVVEASGTEWHAGVENVNWYSGNSVGYFCRCWRVERFC